MLRHSDKNWLVIHCGDNCRHFVRPLRQTISDAGIKLTTRICLAVQTNEECELAGVGWGSLRKGLKRLDNDVGVTLDLPRCRINLLGSRKVVGIWINKEPSLDSSNRQRHLESGVRWKNSQVVRTDELSTGHIRGRRDGTHGSGVAGTTLNLLAVRYREIGQRGTVVDKVVGGCQRRNFASLGGVCVLTVLSKIRSDKA